MVTLVGGIGWWTGGACAAWCSSCRGQTGIKSLEASAQHQESQVWPVPYATQRKRPADPKDRVWAR